MREVFLVEAASPLADNQWLVRGRAWDTVGVGETVYCLRGRVYHTTIQNDQTESVLQTPGEVLLEYPFRVVAAFTYGKPIDQFFAMLTGDMVLEGTNGEILQKGVFLVNLS